MRFLLHIPARVLQAAILLAVVFGLVFVGLTRTEVGRDELRGQIERAFAAEFFGSIEIGELSGNLVYDLTATDVRLRDPDGRTVLSADSVLLRPTWLGLLQRRLVIDEATLVRPRIALVREPGGWNVTETFTARSPSTEPANPLDLSAPSIQIIDGTVTTTNATAGPDVIRSGTLFDYTNARAVALDAALDLDLSSNRKRITVRSLSVRLPDLPLTVTALEGGLTLFDDQLLVRDLALETGESRIAGDFVWGTESDEPRITLTLAPSQISGEEVRRVVPAAPVADAVQISGELRGPLGALDVSALRFARGRTDVTLDGTVTGLPDSAAFQVQSQSATFRVADLEAVVPGIALPNLSGLGTARIDLDADGGFARTDEGLGVRTRSNFDVRSAAGRAQGRLNLAHTPSKPLGYDLDVRTQALDLGRILADSSLTSDLTGHALLTGRGASRDTLASNLRLNLSRSTIAGRRLDTLAVDLVADGLRFTGRIDGRAGGSLALRGTADFDAATYDVQALADGFDLRRVLPTALPTDLTAEAEFVGTGRSLDSFVGTIDVAFQPSSLRLDGVPRPIPEHDVAITLENNPAGRRLAVDGDLVTLRAEGFSDVGDVIALAGQWAGAFVRTGRVEAAKYFRAPPDSLRRPLPPLPAATEAEMQTLTVHAELRRPHVLAALLPGFPSFAPGTSLDAETRLAPDSLHLAVVARGDSLRVPGVESGDFAATLRFAGRYRPTLIGASTLDLTLVADTLGLPIGRLAKATAELALRGRTLGIDIQSERFGEAGRLGLSAELDVRRNVNRLTLREVDLVTGGQQWATPGPQTVDLYADLIRLGELSFERQEAGPTPPRLALHGALSPLTTDSLYVEATALDLNEVFTIIGLRELFGGRLDAELAVASVLRQPIVVGEAEIDRFTFAGRRAGRISLASRYVPGGDGVAVNLHIMPDGDPVSVVNDLRATGSVRLPGTDADGTRDSGALDLALDIDRLDLFVFDWLFPSVVSNAEGYATGTGRITGIPLVPLFDADLDILDGAVRVPDFGLALTAEGELRVDREGFHLRNVLLGDKSGGQGLVRGDILFNDYRFFSFDLTADLAEIEIIDVPESNDLPFYGHIRATGTATLTGPLDNVFLRATDAQTTPDSEMFIPVTATGPASDAGFIVFADSLGNIPEFEARRSVIGQRPEDERAFLDGLEMNLSVFAPPGSTVHLVFDPLIGDVINAVGSGTMQLQIREGEFLTFGTFDVTRGDYLFTAGDVFTRRFELAGNGTLRWDGDPIDARLALPATYRTRASLAGLELPGLDPRQRVPIIITTNVSGRVTSPVVDLTIALDETNRTVPGAEALRRQLNQSDRQAEYATSVLLTNSFLLAPSENPLGIGEAADELFFTSLSQLVSSRLNLFLNQALGSDNVDVLFGVQQGADPDDFDVTYGVALRLLDERLIIRGEGIYQRLEERPVSEELQGEVAVEVRLTPSVSLEVFYRREGDLLLGSGLSATPYGSYGAGLNYETRFPNWRALLNRVIGDAAEEETTSAVSLQP